MRDALSIGDFSRATHLSVKTLRHYHRIGLLEPASIDPGSGYRRYTTDQIPVAQVIKRFRALDMPLDQIGAVLSTTNPQARRDLVAAHLARLEDNLARTQSAAAALRNLLDDPTPGDVRIERRRVEAMDSAAISDVVDHQHVTAWYHGALGELRATARAQGLTVAGSAGAIYDDDLFTQECGRATVFLPCDGPVALTGRIRPLRVPSGELAVITHAGPHEGGIDKAYGALATYVATNEIGVEGPIREYYVVDHDDTADESQWRTEVCWPIFRVTG
ncbi:MAG TPA: MerR family transcriptional regulator [Pseudonocardiaceae bacterium]|jgi:DNA-binding transcriptional MerR regulator